MANPTEATTVQKALETIKVELRKLYGLLSVKELIFNRELVFEIQILERMLSRQGV